MTRRIVVSRACAAFGLLLLLGGCTPLGLAPDAADEVRLVNETDGVLYYVAWELESSHRVDPMPGFDVAGSPLPSLSPGASARVEDIPDYEPGDDVRFFLYALDPDGTRASLAAVRTVTARELRARGGRVVVEAL